MLESKSNQRNLIGKKGILSKFKAIFLYTSSYFIIFSTVQLVEKDKQKNRQTIFSSLLWITCISQLQGLIFIKNLTFYVSLFNQGDCH